MRQAKFPLSPNVHMRCIVCSGVCAPTSSALWCATKPIPAQSLLHRPAKRPIDRCVSRLFSTTCLRSPHRSMSAAASETASARGGGAVRATLPPESSRVTLQARDHGARDSACQLTLTAALFRCTTWTRAVQFPRSKYFSALPHIQPPTPSHTTACR